MKFFNATILLLFIPLCASAQSNYLDKEKREAIDNLFQKWDHPNMPGAAIGIIQNGKMLYSKGYGLANLEHGVPNTSKTAFEISSNSKQFTAACIVLLSQRGTLDLNQSLRSFFPGFPAYAETISIKNLLYHTSGLRDYAQITYLSGLRPNDYYDDADVMKWIKGQKELNYPTGEKYLYCNSGYWLLGQIVKKVSGLSLGDFAKKEIFEPLDMSNTHFFDDNSMLIKNRAATYSAARSGAFRTLLSTNETVGDGGIYTTVEDLKKWDDEFYDQKILNASFWKLMTTQGVLNNGKTIVYAGALEIKEYKGLKTIDHGGRGAGSWSDIIRFPEQKFTVIVLTNRSDAVATPLGYQIADLFLKKEFKKSTEKKTPKRKINTITLSNKTLQKYVASYWNSKVKSSRKVYLEKNTLIYKRGPGSIHPLAAISKHEFKVLGTPPFIVAFVKFIKVGNTYKLMTTENGGEGVPFEVYTPKVYSKKELHSFLGNYYSEEIDSYYQFKMEEGKIRLYINGRKTVVLRHKKDALFTSPMCDFEFKKRNQLIDGVTISTSRVKNVHFKRVH